MIKSLYRRMALAQIASSTTVTFCLLIDSFVIGRLLSPTALGAYGLASPVLNIFAAFGNMMVCGVQVVCGKCMGSGDREGMDDCFSTSIVIAFFLSLSDHDSLHADAGQAEADVHHSCSDDGNRPGV